MEAASPGRHEGLRLLERVTVDGLRGELALAQPDTLAHADVDRRPKLQVHPSRAVSQQMRAKRPSSPRPAEADFSGWNWVPNMLPPSNATASSPP